VDAVITDVDPNAYDGLLCGGLVNPSCLPQSAAQHTSCVYSPRPQADRRTMPPTVSPRLRGVAHRSDPDLKLRIGDDLVNAGAT
jgi:hypothetical protein